MAFMTYGPPLKLDVEVGALLGPDHNGRYMSVKENFGEGWCTVGPATDADIRAAGEHVKEHGPRTLCEFIMVKRISQAAGRLF